MKRGVNGGRETYDEGAEVVSSIMNRTVEQAVSDQYPSFFLSASSRSRSADMKQGTHSGRTASSGFNHTNPISAHTLALFSEYLKLTCSPDASI